MLFTFYSCKNIKQDTQAAATLFEYLPESKTGIDFQNKLSPNKDFNILEYDYYYNGGGVAAADFNNDGLTDLYFTGNQVSAKLYLNEGNFRFKDVTKDAGVNTINWATGIAVADINNDGWQDIYISYAGSLEGEKRRHQLFINNGAGADGIPHFTDEATAYGLADTSFTTQSAFFDYDRDGDLDLLLANHYRSKLNPNLPTNGRKKYIPESKAKLFRNDKGYFTDVTAGTGFNEDGYTLGVSISDINKDGWPDVYMAKDFVFDDALYINNKNGTFTESIKQCLQHTARFSMGCDVADFNNDALPDILTVDMMPDDNQRQKLMNIAMNNERFNLTLALGYMPQYSRNMLQLSNGPDANGVYSFSEIGQLAGVFKTDWSWSPLFADFDNDGWKDIFITNGIPKDITNNDFVTYRRDVLQNISDHQMLIQNLFSEVEKLEPVKKANFMFKNNGNLTFTDSTTDWGLTDKGFSNGAVYADLDNDGDLDIVTNNINATASVYQNNANKITANSYLAVRLNGKNITGAAITISCGGKKQMVEQFTTRGFQSSQDPILHFGTGTAKTVDTVTVVWYDGSFQQLTNVKAGQLLNLNYKDASRNNHAFTNQNNDVRLFKNITSSAGINFLHREKSFEDVDLEPLLPHKYSQTGPFMSAADIDKNGLEDFWIGGPAKYPGYLFMQQKNGRFISKPLPDSNYEDTGGLLFDADGDGDVDLYVASGGNEYNAESERYQDRLYINDGKGNFRRDTSALPIEHFSNSCVVGFDFDKDGDIDIFSGGSVVAGNYPYANPSLLLQNNGKGKFTNVSGIVCTDFANLGLVTGAICTDFDNDGWQDLVVTGEWMPITFFKNDKGKFRQLKNIPGLQNSNGWYASIAAGDFDKDGDTDFIVGNLGLNNKFQVSEKAPLGIYAKDFDNNGTTEPLLTYYLKGKEYTVAGRDDIASVMPSIKKRFDNYSKFSAITFPELYAGSQLEGAYILKAFNFASGYIENRGSGNFSFRPLPTEAQFSTIQSIIIDDINNDGNLDMITAGNNYSPDFMTGRYDASIGLLMLGDGKGNFKTVKATESGIFLKGDVRKISYIKIGNKKSIVAAVNAGYVQLLQKR
jgi:hypothetical protein